jgi:hypothetical protein
MTNPFQFFFFDGASHFITSVIAIFSIISEAPTINYFKNFFVRNVPLLSPEHGFSFLGLSMMSLGVYTLANLNKQATSVENLGLAMWRVVISSGILVSVFGLFAIIAGFVFCHSGEYPISSRQIRNEGAAAVPFASDDKAFSISSGSIKRGPSTRLPTYERTSPQERRASRFPIRMPFRSSALKISKPIPVNSDHWDSRASPVAPEIQRPETALHPAYKPQNPPPIPPSSRYSEVSNMDRFTMV